MTTASPACGQCRRAARRPPADRRAARQSAASRGLASPAISALNERKLWCIDDVAEYLGVPVQTIYGWRPKGYGPPPIKVGKHLRWIPATVVAWAKQQERSAG